MDLGIELECKKNSRFNQTKSLEEKLEFYIGLYD